MENVLRLCHRDIGPDFSYLDLMVGNHANQPADARFPVAAEEKWSELEWAVARKNSLSYIGTRAFERTVDSSRPYFESLTAPEQKILDDYYIFHNDRGGVEENQGFVCMLNQRPSAGRQITSATNNMYTLISNPSLHWITALDRWMLPIEHLLVQGFPVIKELTFPGAAEATPACSFTKSLSGRTRRDVCAQAGNSMQVCVVGSVLQYIIMFTRW